MFNPANNANNNANATNATIGDKGDKGDKAELNDLSKVIKFEINCSAAKVGPSNSGGKWKQLAWLSRGRVMSDGTSAFASFSLVDTKGVNIYAYQPGEPILTPTAQAAVSQGISLDLLIEKGLVSFDWKEVLLNQAQVDKIWEKIAPTCLNPAEGSFTLDQKIQSQMKAKSYKCSLVVKVEMTSAWMKAADKSWVNPQGEIYVTSSWEFREYTVEVGNSIPQGIPVPWLGNNIQEILLEGNDFPIEETFKSKAYLTKFGQRLGSKMGKKAHQIHLQALSWGDEEVQFVALMRLAELGDSPEFRLSRETLQRMVKEVNDEFTLPDTKACQPDTSEEEDDFNTEDSFTPPQQSSSEEEDGIFNI